MIEQTFNGKTYRLYKGERYLSSCKNKMHIDVWKHYNGEIPSGYEIHHIDFDPRNNDISNLVMLSRDEHKKLHGENISEERREFLRKNMEENARPKAIEWHKSEHGKAWHKEHYQDTKGMLHIEKEFICENCGHTFRATVNGHNKFCSNKCKSAYRRKSGTDNEERTCAYCGDTFIVGKYTKTRTCSRSCANRLRNIEKLR